MKISNRSDDVASEAKKHGLNHNIPKAHFARFWGDIEPPARISESRIFHDFSIGAFSYVTGGFFYHTHIGRYCSLSNGLHIGQGNHPVDWLSTHPFQYQGLKFDIGEGFADRDVYYEDLVKADNSQVRKPGQTVIGNDVWIAHGVYIRNDVTIGDGAVIGSRAVVTKDVPPYAIVVGNPARVIRLRFDESIVERLLKIKWWSYAPWQLRDLEFSNVEVALDQLEAKIGDGLEVYKSKIIRIMRNT